LVFWTWKIQEGSTWVLQGVLRIFGVYVVVNRGEIVVKCVVKRGALQVAFGGRRLRHVFAKFL